MELKAFSAIKMKIDQEKNEVRKELAQLLRKKESLEEKLLHERNVFLSRGKAAQGTFKAGSIQSTSFSPARMQQLTKEIDIVHTYVEQTEKRVEILNEKEKQTTKMKTAFQTQEQQKIERKEEQLLRELKMLLTK
ncbi:hypothetical protein [Listeria grayi]|uniref:Flagellar FliJ protein n=2 Tax=Listeria grayi TaxID=1641 RepID=D7V0E4_LISGR|nr:hypothetical protein [Listeria grayi]EFI83037.1 hypothetical protein HMPREF0556_11722 [Listeria grayi DSM 20601]MBC1921262.1 hypothetical protein [Listeria grayi]STY43959.1 Uncharacterised protein [Listeria grayi]